VTVTVTWSEAAQPADEVAVSVKVCVDARLTVVVVSEAGLFTRFAGVQLYVKEPVPVTNPVSVVLVPLGIDTSFPALTTGNGLTVTVALPDTEVLGHDGAV
jgi:hypothetical protein